MTQHVIYDWLVVNCLLRVQTTLLEAYHIELSWYRRSLLTLCDLALERSSLADATTVS